MTNNALVRTQLQLPATAANIASNDIEPEIHFEDRIFMGMPVLGNCVSTVHRPGFRSRDFHIYSCSHTPNYFSPHFRRNRDHDRDRSRSRFHSGNRVRGRRRSSPFRSGTRKWRFICKQNSHGPETHTGVDR